MPFPSYLVPLFQNESSMSLICMKVNSVSYGGFRTKTRFDTEAKDKLRNRLKLTLVLCDVWLRDISIRDCVLDLLKLSELLVQGCRLLSYFIFIVFKFTHCRYVLRAVVLSAQSRFPLILN